MRVRELEIDSPPGSPYWDSGVSDSDLEDESPPAPRTQPEPAPPGVSLDSTMAAPPAAAASVPARTEGPAADGVATGASENERESPAHAHAHAHAHAPPTHPDPGAERGPREAAPAPLVDASTQTDDDAERSGPAQEADASDGPEPGTQVPAALNTDDTAAAAGDDPAEDDPAGGETSVPADAEETTAIPVEPAAAEASSPSVEQGAPFDEDALAGPAAASAADVAPAEVVVEATTDALGESPAEVQPPPADAHTSPAHAADWPSTLGINPSNPLAHAAITAAAPLVDSTLRSITDYWQQRMQQLHAGQEHATHQIHAGHDHVRQQLHAGQEHAAHQIQSGWQQAEATWAHVAGHVETAAIETTGRVLARHAEIRGHVTSGIETGRSEIVHNTSRAWDFCRRALLGAHAPAVPAPAPPPSAPAAAPAAPAAASESAGND